MAPVYVRYVGACWPCFYCLAVLVVEIEMRLVGGLEVALPAALRFAKQVPIVNAVPLPLGRALDHARRLFIACLLCACLVSSLAPFRSPLHSLPLASIPGRYLTASTKWHRRQLDAAVAHDRFEEADALQVRKGWGC